MIRKIVYSAFGLLMVVLLLGVLAPFLSANQYRERIREALQDALQRKVELGEVHYNLFNGPGFSVEDVLIGDESGAGIEPFAHVETLQARLQLKTFFTRKIAFSRLRLVAPSVNLVKTDAGPWNIQTFFQRAASSKEHKPHASIPDIEIVDGRINFKFGLVKSIFYINNADLDIYPNFSGDLVLRFSGEPARTDSGAQGLGHISARGLLHNPGGAEDQVNMAVQLERSALSELVGLFNARDLGVHGTVASNAMLSGPISHIGITGTLEVTDLHRWDLMPAQGEGWSLKYRGLLDLHSQTLDLETDAAPEEKIPVALRFKARDFISAPKWAASMLLKNLPAVSLVDVAKRLGVPVPADVQVEGKVNGGIGIASPGGLQGELALSEAALRSPLSGSARLDSADITISGRQFTMAPAELTLEDGRSARLEASYDADAQDFSMRMATRLLTTADLKSGPGRILDAASIPVLALCHQGSWDGTVRYEKKGDTPGEWSGAFNVQGAELDLPGVASPLRVASASIDVEKGQIHIKNLRGRLGAIGISADYRFDTAGGPQSIRLNAAKAEIAELQRLFMPTLRRRQGLLANLRLRRASIPEWLKERNVEGAVQIKALVHDDAPVCAFKARLVWNGPVAQFTNASCVQDDMEADGRITVNLAGTRPQYRLSGQISNFSAAGGTLDVDGELETAGIGADLLLNANSKGAFTGSDLLLSADTTLRDISGSYQLTAAMTGPRLALSNIQASDGADLYVGQGASLSDGRILLDLTTAAKRQVKLTGNLFPARTPPRAQ